MELILYWNISWDESPHAQVAYSRHYETVGACLHDASRLRHGHNWLSFFNEKSKTCWLILSRDDGEAAYAE